MLYALFLIIGVVCGIAIFYFINRPNNDRAQSSIAQLQQELRQKNEQIADMNRTLAEETTHKQNLEQKLIDHKQEITTLQENARIEFKNLANEIMDQKSAQFKQTNRESLEILLKPFRDNLENFRLRVEQVYDQEAQQRFSLKEQIKALNETNMRMSTEATNLTNALKGNSKVQGDWGEMILETILDNSNLIKGIHYLTQENIKTEEGNNLRPDVILNMPDSKQIVIDSKVSLTAFVAYTESESIETGERYLKDHIKSVRAHIDELGSKRYQSLVNSPDFVIMFMPNEPAFLLSLQHDSSLWNDAYNKKVIISSPTNLFALLKIVDDLWKRDNQSKNALAIAAEGANLYDKFIGFTDSLSDIGKNIDAASKNYEKAINQLKTGKGNLVSRAEKLRDLGVKASKSLPVGLSDYEE